MSEIALTAKQKEDIALLMRAVLEHPDLVDDIAEATGQEISDDPAEMTLQLIHAAVMSPKDFDSAVMNYQSDLGIKNFALGGALLAAGSAIGSLFKNKSSSGETTGFIKGIFQNVKGKIGNWKDRRQIKKALKASGDPNWRQKWREMKPNLKAAQAGGVDLSQMGAGAGGPAAGLPAEEDQPEGGAGGAGGGAAGSGATLGQYAASSGMKVPEGSEDVSVDGLTDAQIKEGIKLLQKRTKQLKTWKIVGISAAVAFAGALIWALVK